MADSDIVRRLVEQAQGQGGPAFARRIPTIQERTALAQDPALSLMAQRAGQSTDAYFSGLDPKAANQHLNRLDRNRMMAMEPPDDGMAFPTQADLNQRYREQQMAAQMPPIPSMPAAPREDKPPHIGEHTPFIRPPVPQNPVPDAGSTIESGATMNPMPTGGTEEGGQGFLAKLRQGLEQFGSATAPAMGVDFNQPPVSAWGEGDDSYLTTGMSGAYRTDSDDGLPAPAGLSYGMDPAGVGAQAMPAGTSLTMPQGQVIPGRPGDTQNAPMQSGIGPIAPSDPAAYNPDTGTRDDTARKASLMERMFGEKGSDQRKHSGKALMMAGAAIMSTPGTIGEAIGAGIQAGLLTYDEAQKALADEAKEARMMGMTEEAHQLDMELKRIAIERGRRVGTVKPQKDPIEEAIVMAARLVTEAGREPEEAMTLALGAQGITSKVSPNRREPDDLMSMLARE